MWLGEKNFWEDFFDLEREVDNFFGGSNLKFNNPPLLLKADNNNYWVPVADIYEDTKCFKFKIDLPGVDKNDVRVKIIEDKLTVSGTRVPEKEEENSKYHFVERAYGDFYREFALPENILQDDVKAEFDKGQLIITIPKTKSSISENVKFISIK